ncbi:MAG: phosphate ABC transporter permease subunit PstC, partial [Prosthecobacter sp.]|nr:phosphate ABC transporter permease subunit PstC [Prosthecobacter sp.]
MLFLLREGAGFLGTYKHELEIYRRAGLEFCDIVDRPLAQQQELSSKLRRALTASMDPLTQQARTRRDAAFLLKREIEEQAKPAREALEAALGKEPAPAAAVLDPLRAQVAAATAKAAAEAKVADVFSAEEAARLRGEFAKLTPEDSALPPMLAELSAAFLAKDKEAKAKFAELAEASDTLEETPEPLRELLDELKETVLATKEAAVEHFTLEEGRQKLLKAAEKARDPEEKADLLKEAAASETPEPDYAASIKPVLERRDELIQEVTRYAKAVQIAAASLHLEVATPEAERLLAEVKEQLPAHAAAMRASIERLKSWRQDKPVSIFSVIGAFFFGTSWLTNSSWQDFFGFVPLLAGSVVIAFIAILIATPLSVAAAIYTNQFATEHEKEVIKPVIEFIQAIPSVVLGFIGISLVGDLIKELSGWSWLSWVPGFPIQERLNMFNAGCLLALMAVPTMFSLAEDALNNVPQAYIDASDALGATKLQTVFRVIVPAAISGIAAAVLLGLGRVIGETMVVLLVAGNRIAIPDFSAGPGVIFQPAHTLTGIIAQELGEVSRGSAHWQALFMVGIVLFVISLGVNACARAVVRRFELPKA